MFRSTDEKNFSILKIDNKNKFKYEPAKIGITYFLVGFIWILFSNLIADKLIGNKDTLAMINTYKGWLYVFVSSYVIYILIQNMLNKIHLSDTKLNESYEKLTLAHEELEATNEELIASEEDLRKQNEEINALYEELAASEEELRQQLDEILLSKELLELSEEKYKTIINNSQNIIYSCDTNGVFIAVNNKFSEFTKIPESKIIGKNIIDLPFYNGSKELSEAIKEVINSGQTTKFQIDYSENAIFTVTVSPILDAKNKVIGVTGTNHNITKAKKSEQIIRRMAYYDDLTGLPNRAFFFDKLEKEIHMATKNSTKLFVLFLDMDNFKRVNDSLGHAFGDELLKEASRRLNACMRDGDTVARISGDEFSILIKNVENTNELLPIIDNILNVFYETFLIGTSSINMTSSVGISVFPQDGELPEDLIRSSDIAMYKAKDLGKNKYQFFNIHMKNELLRKLNTEVMLRKAIKRDEFILYYQPQFDAKTKKLRGLEALIRWNSPELGFMNPLDFISIAEETGLISEIGNWVLNTACAYGKKINDIYGSNITVAVNISPVQLKLTNFYDSVIEAINKSGINPANLELEVTENILIDNFEFSLKIFNDLKKYGVSLSLDDFGTGYSSLSYLKKFPINLLKIDKSFVDEINMMNPKNDFIESIISLIHTLDIQALAEGVEDKFQYDYLADAGIDNIQGYYLGKPLPALDVENALAGTWAL
ncbi:EAL domain-containing protein [Clostridium akagii]|uniref:EAL domain-containing protein n=1 Tax=Clostridium akagii TaxID=91623 RepID=UPI0006902ADF|nr:EAL domain-containing protein [Clostridium akagii]